MKHCHDEFFINTLATHLLGRTMDNPMNEN